MKAVGFKVFQHKTLNIFHVFYCIFMFCTSSLDCLETVLKHIETVRFACVYENGDAHRSYLRPGDFACGQVWREDTSDIRLYIDTIFAESTHRTNQHVDFHVCPMHDHIYMLYLSPTSDCRTLITGCDDEKARYFSIEEGELRCELGMILFTSLYSNFATICAALQDK